MSAGQEILVCVQPALQELSMKCNTRKILLPDKFRHAVYLSAREGSETFNRQFYFGDSQKCLRVMSMRVVG